MANTKITSRVIADDAVTTAAIADDAITSATIADDAVVTASIADDAVGADQLASNAVVTASMADDAVTQDKIADNAVGTAQLKFTATGGTITTAGGYTIHTFTSSGTFNASKAGAVGGDSRALDGTNSKEGGHGGAGTASSITGSSVTRAGGGGGASEHVVGLGTTFPSSILVASNNLAVCALHCCQIERAVTCLEEFIKKDPRRRLHPAILFNLCTLYDLAFDSEGSRRRKRALPIVVKKLGRQSIKLPTPGFSLSAGQLQRLGLQ